MKSHIIIGKHSYGITQKNICWDELAWNYNNEFFQPKLIVGKYCSIGINSKIFLGGNHRHDWVSPYPFHVGWPHNNTFKSILNNTLQGYPHTNGDVIIGNDVWMGENVTIMSGVKIGDGAVVAANSTIVKDIPPYSITGGNPGKHIKYRFSEEVISKFLEIKWWDLEESKLDLLIPYMVSNNIFKFFEEYGKITTP